MLDCRGELAAMMVEPATSALDVGYLETLDEPLKSISRKAIPPSNGDESTPLPEATLRVDQFELDLRSEFLHIFFECDASEVLEKAGSYWKAVVDLCLHIVHNATKTQPDPRYLKMEPRKLPVLLIEDCLDALSVENAKKFWSEYVEPSLDDPGQLLGDLLWKSSTVCHLPFLRVCNQFLRVLETASESDQCEWKGRILTALAKGFSIADRSALKFWGSFHSSTVDYESQETFLANSTKVKTDTIPKMDYSLYESFWSLQADFSNPNRIRLVEFIPKLKVVLEAMESAASSNSDSSTTPKCSSIRYMTASSLLPTQLAHPEFRSSVVSQFLITASHLSAESPPLAKTLAPLLTRAKKLLQNDNPDVYHLLWDSILAHREEAWRKWKKDKCPVSVFDPKQMPEALSDQSPGKSQLVMAGPLGCSVTPMEQDYTSLQSDDLVKICQEMKRSIPTLEEHMEPYVDALDPESGIEAEYHPGSDTLFAWRAMRLFAKQQLPLLKQCRRPADLERITREWYRLQGKDIPGEMPSLEHDSDEELDNNNAQEDKDHEVHEDENEKGEEASKDIGQTDDEGLEDEEGEGSLGEDVKKKDNDNENENEMDVEQGENSDGDSQDEKSPTKASIEEKDVESSDDGSSAYQEDAMKSNETRDTEHNQGANAEEVASSKGRDSNSNEIVNKNINHHEEHVESMDEVISEDKNEDITATKSQLEQKRPISPNAPSRRDPGDEKDDNHDKAGGSRSRKEDLSRKRDRSRSVDLDRQNAPRVPPREGSSDERRGRGRSSGENRAGGRRDDGPPRVRGRHEDSPPSAWASRREEALPSRLGRGGGGPPPHRDDGPHTAGRAGPVGRPGDGPPSRGGRHDGPPQPRRHDDIPPAPRGGGRGSDRRDDRQRGVGGERRRGRDDSRFRARR